METRTSQAPAADKLAPLPAAKPRAGDAPRHPQIPLPAATPETAQAVQAVGFQDHANSEWDGSQEWPGSWQWEAGYTDPQEWGGDASMAWAGDQWDPAYSGTTEWGAGFPAPQAPQAAAPAAATANPPPPRPPSRLHDDSWVLPPAVAGASRTASPRRPSVSVSDGATVTFGRAAVARKIGKGATGSVQALCRKAAAWISMLLERLGVKDRPRKDVMFVAAAVLAGVVPLMVLLTVWALRPEAAAVRRRTIQAQHFSPPAGLGVNGGAFPGATPGSPGDLGPDYQGGLTGPSSPGNQNPFYSNYTPPDNSGSPAYSYAPPSGGGSSGGVGRGGGNSDPPPVYNPPTTTPPTTQPPGPPTAPAPITGGGVLSGVPVGAVSGCAQVTAGVSPHMLCRDGLAGQNQQHTVTWMNGQRALRYSCTPDKSRCTGKAADAPGVTFTLGARQVTQTQVSGGWSVTVTYTASGGLTGTWAETLVEDNAGNIQKIAYNVNLTYLTAAQDTSTLSR